MQLAVLSKDFLNQLETKSLGLVIHAATISACAAALQWLQCLQAGVWLQLSVLSFKLAGCLPSSYVNLQVLEQMCHTLG